MSSGRDQVGSRNGLAAVQPPDRGWVALIERTARGDTAALAALYDATAPAVYGLALRILGDRGAAEEVTVDAFMQCWRQARSYDPTRSGPLAWLLVIVRSRAIDRLRAGSSARLRTEPFRAALGVASDAPGPEEEAAVSQRRQLVTGALARLGSEQRQVIELAYFRGLSHVEIAEALAQPLGTVKTRIRLGMLALHKALGAEGRESL